MFGPCLEIRRLRRRRRRRMPAGRLHDPDFPVPGRRRRITFQTAITVSVFSPSLGAVLFSTSSSPRPRRTALCRRLSRDSYLYNIIIIVYTHHIYCRTLLFSCARDGCSSPIGCIQYCIRSYYTSYCHDVHIGVSKLGFYSFFLRLSLSSRCSIYIGTYTCTIMYRTSSTVYRSDDCSIRT